MGERVRLANGTLDIESAPGRGTSVIAWLPFDGGAS
jgi:signal transduction histidine kinase